jgi:hypothetical protein
MEWGWRVKFHKRYFYKYHGLKKTLSMRKVFTRQEGSVHIEEQYIGKNFTQLNFKRYVLDTWKLTYLSVGLQGQDLDWNGSEE